MNPISGLDPAPLSGLNFGTGGMSGAGGAARGLSGNASGGAGGGMQGGPGLDILSLLNALQGGGDQGGSNFSSLLTGIGAGGGLGAGAGFGGIGGGGGGGFGGGPGPDTGFMTAGATGQQTGGPTGAGNIDPLAFLQKLLGLGKQGANLFSQLQGGGDTGGTPTPSSGTFAGTASPTTPTTVDPSQIFEGINANPWAATTVDPSQIFSGIDAGGPSPGFEALQSGGPFGQDAAAGTGAGGGGVGGLGLGDIGTGLGGLSNLLGLIQNIRGGNPIGALQSGVGLANTASGLFGGPTLGSLAGQGLSALGGAGSLAGAGASAGEGVIGGLEAGIGAGTEGLGAAASGAAGALGDLWGPLAAIVVDAIMRSGTNQKGDALSLGTFGALNSQGGGLWGLLPNREMPGVVHEAQTAQKNIGLMMPQFARAEADWSKLPGLIRSGDVKGLQDAYDAFTQAYGAGGQFSNVANVSSRAGGGGAGAAVQADVGRRQIFPKSAVGQVTALEALRALGAPLQGINASYGTTPYAAEPTGVQHPAVAGGAPWGTPAGGWPSRQTLLSQLQPYAGTFAPAQAAIQSLGNYNPLLAPIDYSGA